MSGRAQGSGRVSGPCDTACMTHEATTPQGEQDDDRSPAVVPPAVTGRDVSETAMRAVVEIDAAIAGLQAMRTELLAGIGHVAIDDARAERLDPGVGVRDVACELALLTRRSDRTIEAELSHAMADTSSWPATIRAWGAAKIHRGHVAVIVDVGSPLQDAEARAAFEAALLPHAERMNPGRLRALARRELDRRLQRPLAERHRAARAQRGVFLRTLDDGISHLDVIGPTVLLTGIFDRLTQMAKATRRADRAAAKAATRTGDTERTGASEGTERARDTGATGGTEAAEASEAAEAAEATFDQLRADLLCDLLLTGDPSGDALAGIAAKVELVVPPELTLSTLLAAAGVAHVTFDLDPVGAAAATTDSIDSRDSDLAVDGPAPPSDRPAAARLSNGDPVDPETARLLMARAEEWLRVFTDPVTGQVLAADSYAIPERLKRLLRARDQRCRWPGCNQRAERCDVDHTHPWADGGRTEHDNLAHLCRRHHTLKGAQLSGARRWKVRQIRAGVLEFTSPAGHAYVDEPPTVGPVFTDPWAGHPQPVGATAGRLPY